MDGSYLTRLSPSRVSFLHRGEGYLRIFQVKNPSDLNISLRTNVGIGPQLRSPLARISPQRSPPILPYQPSLPFLSCLPATAASLLTISTFIRHIFFPVLLLLLSLSPHSASLTPHNPYIHFTPSLYTTAVHVSILNLLQSLPLDGQPFTEAGWKQCVFLVETEKGQRTSLGS